MIPQCLQTEKENCRDKEVNDIEKKRITVNSRKGEIANICAETSN